MSLSVAYAQSQKEQNNEPVQLGVMQGPTGFSSVALGDTVQVSVFPSPNEAVARLINGELDMAVLPANNVAALVNKGTEIVALAVVGEGMLSLVGTDISSDTVYVPGPSGTPYHMASILYPEYELNYSISAPAQIAQMLIAGKIKLALLPQPFVSMVTAKNNAVEILNDVQNKWKEKTGNSNYPMSILVCSVSFFENNKNAVKQVLKAYEKSVSWVIENPLEAGKAIEEKEIMQASLASPAISSCALVFKTGNSALNEVISYYEILYTLFPEAIGGKIPEKDFWKNL